jgi:signal transduction histidine kinase/AmiR/NasT family two-component response regulator
LNSRLANSPPNDLELDVAGKVRVQQMRSLFEGGPVATIAATLFAFAMAFNMRGEVTDDALIIWLAVKCAVALPRMVHTMLFARQSKDELRWLNQYRLLLLLDGLAWGSAALLLMPANESGVTVLVATLCGVATISTFNIHGDWRSCVLFVVPMLTPSIGGLLLRFDAFGLYGGVAVLCYLYLLLSAARRSERRVFELLMLRFTNADLTQALTKALDKSTEEAKAKDSFVAGMSHELRTPLHGILGLSRQLQRSVGLGDKQTVKLIIRSGEHLLGLINNVLEFSKFEAHGVDIDIDPQDVDISATIADVVALCTPGAEDRQVDLDFEVAASHQVVASIDPFRLRQILLNLVGNAVKFTDTGGRVRVGLAPSEDGKSFIISVADSGIGMTAATIEKIFDPFSQADISTTRRHGGTGLGLNITRAICRKLGGDIRCTSILGRGSVFTVELPLRHATVLTQRTSRVDSGFADLEHSGATHGTVLLAEDNDVNALVGEYALARLGVEVTRAETGTAVVERMCTNGVRPNLVLLDCQMPVMDGYEAARLVRDYERRNGLPAVPIVALTASVFQADREHCREVGMDAFLSKPFSDDELRGVLTLFSVIPRDRTRSESSYAALLL